MGNIFSRILDVLTERKRDAIWGILFCIIFGYMSYSIVLIDMEPLCNIIVDSFPNKISYAIWNFWQTIGVIFFIILALIMLVTVIVALLPDNRK